MRERLDDSNSSNPADWIATVSTTQPRATPFWLLPLPVCLLFLSGISALVYQVLWLRLLSLTFGVTTHAASTVLASFMGGLRSAASSPAASPIALPVRCGSSASSSS